MFNLNDLVKEVQNFNNRLNNSGNRVNAAAQGSAINIPNAPKPEISVRPLSVSGTTQTNGNSGHILPGINAAQARFNQAPTSQMLNNFRFAPHVPKQASTPMNNMGNCAAAPEGQLVYRSQENLFHDAKVKIMIYGDERDDIIAKWNALQTAWGSGTMYFSQNTAPINLTTDNALCLFKSVAYSRIPGKDNSLGFVAVNFNRPLKFLKDTKLQLLNYFILLLGNKPHLIVSFEAMRDCSEQTSQLIMFVEELSPNGLRRILATDLANYLVQPSSRSQLTEIGVTDVFPFIRPDGNQLAEYLNNAPKGISPLLWQQAQMNNPNPNNLIPIPVIGFNDLKQHMINQNNRISQHDTYISALINDVRMLKMRCDVAAAKVSEHKNILSNLKQAIFRVVASQECDRKNAAPMNATENDLQAHLNGMQVPLRSSSKFKRGLDEILHKMRQNEYQNRFENQSGSGLNTEIENDIKSFLTVQQKGLQALTKTVKKDMKSLQVIIEDMRNFL